jgi:signal transduction histidine kinase
VLDDFIISQRDAIVARARERVASRSNPSPTDLEVTSGVPVFLEQLVVALRLAKSSSKVDHEEIGKSAARHGLELLRMGLTIAQVVHDYGDVCQVITELALEMRAPISGEEFRILNLCLDDAIAGAVTEYARQRENVLAEQGTERLGILAHEQRNLLNTAMLSFEILKGGQVAVGGSTGLVLGRSLMGLCALIDRSLADVRLDAGIERLEHISVADFIGEVEIGASIQAQSRRIQLWMAPVERTLYIEGDRQVLAAAISNLLENGFKFSRPHGTVSLTTTATADRVLFEVEDECGGLPPGKAEELFLPFEQRGADRSGIGLGLTICGKAAKANGGELRVRDLPGKGCVFTLDLPRKPPPPLSVVTKEKAATGVPGAPAGAGKLQSG